MGDISSQSNPRVDNGVATFIASTTVGQKFPVPDSWAKIVIAADVTVTGSFFVAARSRTNNGLTIEGKDRYTSVIVGSGRFDAAGTPDARQKSNIRYEGPGTLAVRRLTSLNPDKFHIWGGGDVIVEDCDIIDNRKQHMTDGVHAGLGSNSVVRNCFIDTYDDAMYVTEVGLVESTTIVHNRNGAPFQVGWGPKDYRGCPVCRVRGCHVIGNSDFYNQGLVSWASKSDDGSFENCVTVRFENLRRSCMGKACASVMCQLGAGRNGRVDSAVLRI